MGDNLVGFIKAWLAQQTKAIYPPQWQGGWERWAQGQVALFMEGTNGYQVLTEQNIYEDSDDAVDLEFRNPSAKVRSFCELKCYGSANDDTPNTFINNILDDWAKVQEPLKAEYKASILWVIGLSQAVWRKSIEEERQKAKHAEFQKFKMDSVDALGQPGPYSTFDIWYRSYVNNN